MTGVIYRGQLLASGSTAHQLHQARQWKKLDEHLDNQGLPMTEPTSSSAPQAGGDETPVAYRWKYGNTAHHKWVVADYLPPKDAGVFALQPLFTRPTPAAAAEVPTGWKLVPIEPTPDMVEAACCSADNGKFSGEYLRSILKAVFAASPVAPAGVPSYDECKTGNVLLDLLMRDRFATTQWPENWMAVRGLLIEAQRLVSAGAPAVPLQPTQHG